ncbi:hypothetical protein BDY21DRAFT_296496 [Lineolata rhizophorae]|uniref:Chorismate synthase protein n=1 Tax=Lineolata rhizophorae TaxID=578093 RepID=A0A6A6PBS4_9PEZI|nr:hypothetical protein BDY21DRAFT_296496 [Lineolata rhizophorae]
MMSLKTIGSLLLTFGPLVIPRLLAWYRSLSSNRAYNIPIRPPPRHVKRALNILTISAIIALLTTLPFQPFTPENVITVTHSRLQTPTATIFNRLEFLRALTPLDHALRDKLTNLESRLLYLTYGPDVLATCPFCTSTDPRSYFYYAIPSLLFPHVLHLVVLGVVTSAPLSGSEGARLRVPATIAGVALATLELLVAGTYDARAANAGPAKSVADGGGGDAFFWRARLARGLAVGAADALVGLFLYQTATNRWLAEPPSLPERVEGATRALEAANAKLGYAGAVRNAVVRDKGLREAFERYWLEEHRVMGEVREEREVVEGVRSALTRVDIGDVERKAEEWVGGIFGRQRGQSSGGVRVGSPGVASGSDMWAGGSRWRAARGASANCESDEPI